MMQLSLRRFCNSHHPKHTEEEAVIEQLGTQDVII